MSISGFVRPLVRYALPTSLMNDVGECVWRDADGSSPPRGARLPPTMVSFESALFSASYVVASSCSYAAAAASPPLESNCGIQNRLRFGSLPTRTVRTDGSAWTSATAYSLNAVRDASSSGVEEL